MESNKTLLVGCGINHAFNHAFNQNKNSFLHSKFTYEEILPKMFNDTSDTCELKLKFKNYLNNHKNDLEEFLRYNFAGAIGTTSARIGYQTNIKISCRCITVGRVL